MVGFHMESSDPREFRMVWEAETPVLTAAVTRSASIGVAVVFAFALGVLYLLDPGAPGAALRGAAIVAGTAVALGGIVVFGLLSNRVRTRFTVTADGYAAALSDRRLTWLRLDNWLRPGNVGRNAVHPWDRVTRVRLDAEYGRVLVQLRDDGWRAIRCPDGAFVSAAREIRRLIDEAKAAAPASEPEAWSRPTAQRRTVGPLSGTAA